MPGFTGASMMQGQFWAYIDGEGYIVAQDYTQARRIGVTLQKYNQKEKEANDAVAKAEEFYDELVKYGHRQRELTPEQRLEQLQTQMASLTSLVEQQAQMISALTSDKAKKKAIDPEIMPAHTGENINDRFVATGGNSQALVSQ